MQILRASCLVLVLVAGCGLSGSPPTTATVGALGGVVQVPNGPTLAIVPNALAADTVITVTARSTRQAGALSTVYDFGPPGLTFARPATLSIPVDPSVTEAAIVVDGSESLPALVANGVASVQVTHLASGYAGASANHKRTVSGTIATVYWADDGSKTTLPGSLGAPLTVAAIWIPAGSNYRRVPVSFANSSFSVSDVPEGPYFLQVNTQWDATYSMVDLIELTTSTPDLTTVVTARPDLHVAANPTSFTLDAAGLTPWVKSAGDFSGDMLLFAGSQAHVYGRPQAGGGAAAPAAGLTNWHANYDWNKMTTAGALGLPDASKGDVEFFYQRSSIPLGSGATQGVAHVATRYQRLDNLTLHDGVAASASLNLAAAPLTGALRANLRNSLWATLLTDSNPAMKPFRAQGVSVLAIPRSLEFPDQPSLSAGTSLAYIQGPALQDADYGTVAYGQFLGPSWKEARYVSYLAYAEVPQPGTAATYSAPAFFASFEPMPAVEAIVPVLGPPRLPRIAGRDAFQAQTSVGLTPTISWSPPALGAATSYAVRIDPVTPQNSVIDPVSGTRPVTSISLTVYGVTSVQVPEGLLQDGVQYAITITSTSAPWDRLDRAPFRTGMPYSSADCVTAVFAP